MKRSKYRNIKTEVHGITFASKKEAYRYCELKLLQRASEISDLELQPRYDIVINGMKVCTYVADFRYKESGETITEDAKGMLTPMYRLKKKLMKACHGIEIKEV
jgi:hypothetical protein